MEYKYEIESFNPSSLGGYGVVLESPWGQVEVFNIRPEIIDDPENYELTFTMLKDDIRYFELESAFSADQIGEIKEFVSDFYDNENFYERSKDRFFIYNEAQRIRELGIDNVIEDDFKEDDLIYFPSRPDYGIYKVVRRKEELCLYRNMTLGPLYELPDPTIITDREVNWDDWEDIEFGGSTSPYTDPYCWLSWKEEDRPYFPIEIKENGK